MARYVRRILTAQQLDAYHRDGFLTVPDVYRAEDMDTALSELDGIVYGMPYQDWAAPFATGGSRPPAPDGASQVANPGRTHFPTGVDVLDRLVENKTYLDIVCDLLETEDITYINGHLFIRSGPTDTRHPANPWEGFHFDHQTASYLPPCNQPNAYDYIGSGILLHDVTEDCAPTAMIPGSHRIVSSILPRLAKEGVYQSGGFTDVRKVPEFAARTPFIGKRGSVGFSSSYLVHAAIPFQNKTKQRAYWTMSFGRTAQAAFIRHASLFDYQQRAFSVPFWKKTTTRVRSLCGWPPPGSPYYTPETLELLAIQFPGMDLSDYAAVLNGAPSSGKATLAVG